ncbi:MAG TPA: hypothetical protein VNQ90_12980 [Chthoniobacteraceae bacterium]|nr:hypothetical protein [Chthoniobacteraceae bacterium]
MMHTLDSSRTFRLPRLRNLVAAALLALLLFAPTTGHAQQTPAQWQARAVAEYPDLAVRDSPFNRRFLERLQERKAADPTYPQDAAWPWMLAREVAQELNQPAASEGAEAGTAAGEAPATAPADGAETPAAAAETAQTPPAAEKPSPKTEASGNDTGATTSEWTASSVPDALVLESARFRWWAPEGVTPRGVLVLVPGRGGDGRGMADKAQWRTLATELQFGIVACALKNTKGEPGTYQSDPDGKTSELVDQAVNELLALNGHQIKDPPLAFYGTSAGANVAQNYARVHPERVVAAVLMRCPNGPGKFNHGKTEVPLLVAVGLKDRPEWVATSLKIYEEGLAKKALWTLAAHPDEGHGVGKTSELSVAFLKGAVTLRLGEPQAGGGVVKPKKVSRQSGWLGDTETFEIGDSHSFKGKKQKATWLPDEATAIAWQNYLKGS